MTSKILSAQVRSSRLPTFGKRSSRDAPGARGLQLGAMNFGSGPGFVGNSDLLALTSENNILLRAEGETGVTCNMCTKMSGRRVYSGSTCIVLLNAMFRLGTA